MAELEDVYVKESNYQRPNKIAIIYGCSVVVMILINIIGIIIGTIGNYKAECYNSKILTLHDYIFINTTVSLIMFVFSFIIIIVGTVLGNLNNILWKGILSGIVPCTIFTIFGIVMLSHQFKACITEEKLICILVVIKTIIDSIYTIGSCIVFSKQEIR